jgi:hypothetical protein
VSDRSSPPVKLDYRLSHCLFHFEYLPLAKRRFLGWLCGGRCWCDCAECQKHFEKIFPEQNKLALLKIGKVGSPDVLHPLPPTGGDRINVE